ncbi:hypothetical protein GCM10022222_26760 [Amycolatopsis ultiminotia]|uniref:Site-specific recombinase XerD n=1 Tax=Amycolatopsis ultiminotia TaxID=543629 RepID=A0ABP6VYF2_9PSEU
MTAAASHPDAATPSYGVALRAKIAADNLADLGAWIAAAVPELDEPAAATLVEFISHGRRGLAMLHRHLGTHPDALTSGESDCPTVFLRLVRSLARQGYSVTPLRCHGCGRGGLTLSCHIPGGRLCGTCASSCRARPCSRCGRVRTVHARADGNPSASPATATIRPPAPAAGPAATSRGSPRTHSICRRCYQPPTRICIHCGQNKRPRVRTGDGPICAACLTHPPRRCQRCGTITKLATRSDARVDLCHACLPTRNHTECHLCGQLGPWRISTRLDGKKTCPDCLRATFIAQQQECALCHQSRRIITTWPLGPVCGTCYKRTRTHRGTCTHCSTAEILLGRDTTGAGLCATCSGTTRHDYRCTRCGDTGFFLTAGLCTRCQTGDRVHELLADNNNHIPAQLEPFAQALRTADSPEAVRQWLRPGQPAATLLNHLTTLGEPISHDLLDTLGQTLALQRLRQTLIHTRVLPDRADYLERLVPWLEDQLHGHPPDRAHLLRTYTHWTLLRRARQRTRIRPFTPSAGNWLRTRVRATLNFLTWLDQQHLTLPTVTQTRDRPLADSDPPPTHTDATYAAREFLYWARQHHLAGDVTIPKKPHHNTLAPITEDDRWTQLRHCLHEQALPINVRAAGALVLLFGLPVSRITTLQHRDIHTDRDGTNWLQMTHHRLLLPAAVAALLRDQRDHGTGAATLDRDQHQWLFPGGLPGRPARDGLYRALRAHLPVHLRRARSAALAALAADIPAAVLAQLLDINISTAIAWANYAQHDWSAYLAAPTHHTSHGKLDPS